jgi:hypothetical protein
MASGRTNDLVFIEANEGAVNTSRLVPRLPSRPAGGGRRPERTAQEGREPGRIPRSRPPWNFRDAEPGKLEN